MSCLSGILSLFRKSETVNGESYDVIKRVGEGGKCIPSRSTENRDLLFLQAFPTST